MAEPWAATRGAIKLALGLQRPAGRSVFPVFRDDLFLVSYPKSGNTWLRFLLGNLLWRDQEVTFETIESLVPDIYRRSNRELLVQPRPRVLKSHEPLDSRYPKVVYVVRDPRSVVVSYARYKARMGVLPDDASYDRAARRVFENGEPVGTWQDHVEGWRAWSTDHPDRCLFIRYEDLLRRGLAELGRLAEFVAVDVDNERLEAALGASSLDAMKKLEKRAGTAWSDAARSAKPEIPFVRGGKLAEWKAELPDSTLEMVESRCSSAMKAFGYEPGR